MLMYALLVEIWRFDNWGTILCWPRSHRVHKANGRERSKSRWHINSHSVQRSQPKWKSQGWVYPRAREAFPLRWSVKMSSDTHSVKSCRSRKEILFMIRSVSMTSKISNKKAWRITFDNWKSYFMMLYRVVAWPIGFKLILQIEFSVSKFHCLNWFHVRYECHKILKLPHLLYIFQRSRGRQRFSSRNSLGWISLIRSLPFLRRRHVRPCRTSSWSC